MGNTSQRKLAQPFFGINIEVKKEYEKKNSAIIFDWICF